MGVSAVTIETQGPVQITRIDTGKVNPLSLDSVRALQTIVRAAEADAAIRCLVIEGRPGAFSAGLDTATVSRGDAETDALLLAMGELLQALYASRLRVVAGCTGHAVAAGAMLLLVSDVRIGVAGPYRVGFSEVSLGLPLPELPILLARDRLSPRWLETVTVQGQLLDPEAALAAGFLDEIVAADGLEARALERAQQLALLDEAAVVSTQNRLRHATLAQIEVLLDVMRAPSR